MVLKLFKMSNPFDFFEEIWCINLDHRLDRWEHAQKEFEKVNILNRVHRFSAIKHTDGRIGLIKSFLYLFEYAKNKKLENILIFEDDIKFLNDTTNILRKSLEQLIKTNINWGMFYLGANTHKKLVKVDENLFNLKSGLSAHAICYNKIIYDDIINKFSKTDRILEMGDINDIFYSKLQDTYNCFIVNPIIATQIPSYSDLLKKDVNYSFIVDRFNMNVKN